ncbi:MAG: Hypothetical protein AJITA_00465 [Acetilactobacillus jinshanensis]
MALSPAGSKTIPKTLLWTFANSSSPLDALSTKFLGNTMAIIMDLAIFLSGLASILGSANACAYMLYALGKHHYLPPFLSNIYPVPKFPGNLYPYIIIGWIVIGFSSFADP